MKISPQTLEVLKNFSKINPNFLMEESDKTLRTAAVSGDMVAFAEIPETLPRFAIYDLNEFLPLATSFQDADFEFGESSVKISSGKSKFTYTYCSERLIEGRPPRNLKSPSADVVIEKLDKATMKTLLQAASSLAVDKICFKSVGGKIEAHAVADKNEGNTNSFSIELCDAPEGKRFEYYLSLQAFKFIQADYKVQFFGKKAAMFSSDLGQDHSVRYLTSLSTASVYEG